MFYVALSRSQERPYHGVRCFHKEAISGVLWMGDIQCRDPADDRMIYTDDPRRMISRMQRDGNDFGCYFYTQFAACFASSGGSEFHNQEGYPCQRLQTKEVCTIFWVPYIARDPIPPRAVIIGHMANGDRVYVTKFDYNQPPVQSLAGHYVEGAENTFAEHDQGRCLSPGPRWLSIRPLTLEVDLQWTFVMCMSILLMVK